MLDRRTFLRNSLLTLAGLSLTRSASSAPSNSTPNIVYVLGDDFGFGDAACFDSRYSKVPTPNIDRLASQGMRFTAAHSPSSVCSPSRYGLLTGRYPWRSSLQQGVLRPYDPPLIAADRLTVPKFLKARGYHTACIGKWHLGWDWPMKSGAGKKQELPSRVPDFTQPIPGGPITRGFDLYFGTDVPNYPPYCFIENDRVTALPTGHFNADKSIVVNTPGPMAPGWRFDRILPTLAERAVSYIDERAKSKQPFFLYFPLTTPHEPITPSERFKGKSGISPVADLIMESDWALGQVMDALEKNGLAQNTLLIFTTDNGHCSYTGVEAFEKAGHRVSGPFRGLKSTVWEGGTRLPFVVRWPGKVHPGAACDRLICHTDLLATLAELYNEKLPPGAGEDSVSFLPLLADPAAPGLRADLVTMSAGGRFMIQRGEWKLILSPGAGGYGAPPTDQQALQQGLPQVQLYNLAEDVAEQNNLQAQHPEKVKELTQLLERYVREGRSTPGAPQRNDVEVNFRKPIPQSAAKKKKQAAPRRKSKSQ